MVTRCAPALLALWFLPVACSTPRCIEGTSVGCSCTNGNRGAQLCQSDGTFGPCQCTGSGGLDAGGNDSGTGPDAGPAVLFHEDFATFPGTNWTVQCGATCPTQDLDSGNPPPSVSFMSQGGGSIHYVGNPFPVGSGTTFVFEGAVDAGSACAGAEVRWTDVNTSSYISMTFSEASSGGSANCLGVQYNNSCGNGCTLGGAQLPFTPDSRFHSYAVSLDASGGFKCWRDGILMGSGTGFPTGAQIRPWATAVGGSLGCTAAGGWLDNFEVTQP